MQQTQLDVRQFSQFISRSGNLKIDHFRRAGVAFCSEVIYVDLGGPQKGCHQAIFSLNIIDQERLDTQIPLANPMRGPCTQSTRCHLLQSGSSHRRRGSCILEGNGHYPRAAIFHLFPAVVALRLSGGVGAYIASGSKTPPTRRRWSESLMYFQRSI